MRTIAYLLSKFLLPLFLLLLICSHGYAQAARHNLAVAAYFSEGDYGEVSDTTIYYFPLSYDYSLERWNFKLTVPHLQITGSANVLVNIGGVGATEASSGRLVSARGLGDTTAAVTYQLDPFVENAPFVDLTFEVKLPTADEHKGLGTGQTDYAAQVDLYQMLGESTVFATLGYKTRGESELFAGLKDSSYVSMGVTIPFDEQWSAGLIYDYREAASDFSRETHELLPYLSWTPSAQWTLMSYVVKGFTRDSADIAAGAQLSYRW